MNRNNFIDKYHYDKSNACNIFDYSKDLLGKTLREFATKDYELIKGKGNLGQMVENLFFNIATNSNPNADFSEAGVELKCTPLKYGKNNEYLIKERLVCNMINYCEVVKEDFSHSHFFLKCKLMLLLFYLYQKGQEVIDFKFIFSVLWELPEKDLRIIEQDYNTIIDKIKRGEAHLLSEGDTMYLGACRKGQKGDSLMKQPYSEQGAPRRAFSLKMAYMRVVLRYVIDSGQNAVTNYTGYKIENDKHKELVKAKDLKELKFDDIILKRLQPFWGNSYREIADIKGVDLSRNPKNKFALIANSIIGEGNKSNVNQSEEFQKAGLTMKTIRVQENGNIKEAMSFENIDYLEIAECENWYESRLYELFSNRFLFVIFKEQNKGKEDYVLDDAFFWTMPQEDLNLAEEYWEHIRKNVLEEHISEEYWWKAADKKKFHVRPKAQKATDLAPTINDKKAKKFCYWFNNDYISEIVRKRQKENE